MRRAALTTLLMLGLVACAQPQPANSVATESSAWLNMSPSGRAIYIAGLAQGRMVNDESEISQNNGYKLAAICQKNFNYSDMATDLTDLVKVNGLDRVDNALLVEYEIVKNCPGLEGNPTSAERYLQRLKQIQAMPAVIHLNPDGSLPSYLK